MSLTVGYFHRQCEAFVSYAQRFHDVGDGTWRQVNGLQRTTASDGGMVDVAIYLLRHGMGALAQSQGSFMEARTSASLLALEYLLAEERTHGDTGLAPTRSGSPRDRDRIPRG